MMKTLLSHPVSRFIFSACFLFAMLPARADYDCGKRERPLTQTQTDTFNRALLAMQAAISAPPEGWTMSRYDLTRPPTTLCTDFKDSPIRFGVTVRYAIEATLEDKRKRRDAIEARDREVRELEKLPADKQAEYDRLNALATAVRREAREARRPQTGTPNIELATAKEKENMEIGRQRDKIFSDYRESINAPRAAIYKKYEPLADLNRSVDVEIRLNANDNIRSANKSETIIGSNAKTNQATDRVVRIATRIELINSPKENPKFAQQMDVVKALIDRAKLEAIISGKTPSAEESNAFIATQTELAAVREKEARTREKEFNAEPRQRERDAITAEANAKKAEKAAPTGNTTSSAPTAEAAPTSTNTKTASATPAEAPTPTPAKPAATSATEAANKAKEAANKLKGLFGR